jgi:hypothetical protein
MRSHLSCQSKRELYGRLLLGIEERPQHSRKSSLMNCRSNKLCTYIRDSVSEPSRRLETNYYTSASVKYIVYVFSSAQRQQKEYVYIIDIFVLHEPKLYSFFAYFPLHTRMR